MKKNFRRKNPVARVLNEVNRPQTHRARTAYERRPKHRENYSAFVVYEQA